MRYGYKETFTVVNKDNHLAKCLFQSTECPFRKLYGVDCPRTGTMTDKALHIIVEHESETAELQEHLKAELLDFVIVWRHRKVIFILGELFYFVWEREGSVFSFGVFHFRPKNETKNFKHCIKMGNSAEYVAVTRKCHCYLEGGLKDIHPGKCVTLQYVTVQECLGEHGKLSCEIEIGKWKLVGFVMGEMQDFLPVVFAISSEIEIGRQKLHKPPPPRPPSLPPPPPSQPPSPPPPPQPPPPLQKDMLCMKLNWISK